MERSFAPFTGRVADVDIRSLRVFCAVVRNGGLSLAEAELQISLSAISRDIANLEGRTGLKLCTRGKSGFALTDAGRRFHKEALGLLQVVDNFGKQIGNLYADGRSAINVGVVDLLWSHPSGKITRILSAFSRAEKKAHLNMRLLSPNEIEHGVKGGTLDAGLVISRRKISSLSYEKLFVENNFLYCGQGHPLFDRPDDDMSLSEIRTYPFAGRVSPRVASMRWKLARQATCDGADLIAMLISTGDYLGFLPEHFVASLADATRFRAILPSKINASIPVFLVTRRPASDNKLVHSLVRITRRVNDEDRRDT